MYGENKYSRFRDALSVVSIFIRDVIQEYYIGSNRILQWWPAKQKLLPRKRLVLQEIYRLHIYIKNLFCEIKRIKKIKLKYGNFTSAILCIKITGAQNIGGHRFLTELKEVENHATKP